MALKSDSAAIMLQSNALSSLYESLLEKQGKTRVYSVNASRLTTIVGIYGIRFTFQPASFCTLSGDPVEGEVQLHLLEVSEKWEMLLANRTTTSEDRLLECAGQFCLYATQHHLLLALAKPIQVQMPIPDALVNAVAVRLFGGSSSTVLPFYAERIFDWKLIADKPLAVRKVSNKKFFQFEIETFNWYSCQSFLTKKTAGRAMLSAKCVSEIEQFDDQVAFLVFKDFQAVARMHFNRNRFTAINLPTGLPASVVIITQKEQQMFLGTKAIESISSCLLPVAMTPVEEDHLLETLCSL